MTVPQPSPRTVWLFPGQGMERPRMGLALAEEFPAARALLQLAGEEAQVDAFRLLRRGGPDLQRTAVLQPLLTAVSLGVALALRQAGHAPDAVAGHSLGEIAAWSAAGGVPPEDAVRLAGARGRCMQEAARTRSGAMLAILADESALDEARRAAAAVGTVDLAAHNAPEEWVLTGTRSALEAAARVAPSKWLDVSGPWHSRLMAGAETALAIALARVPRPPLRCELWCNRTGRPAASDALPTLIAEQLTHPVRWAETLAGLAGPHTRFVTVGPGRVLRGLLRKNLGDGPIVLTTEHPEDLQRTVTALRERTTP